MGIADMLGSLMDKIPGYAGFKERAKRRETDKIQREFMAKRLTELKSNMMSIQEDFLSSGNLAIMEPFDKAGNKIDRVVERMRHANQGYTGFFDAVSINEEELENIYRYDLSLVNGIASAEEALMAVESSVDDPAKTKMMLRNFTSRIDDMDKALNERETILKGVR